MIDGGLRQLFRQHLPKVHWQAIETGGTGRGIPDLNGCLGGIEAWIELKGPKTPMRPEQVAWIERRARAGGRVFIALRKPRDTLILLPARGARALLEKTLPATLGRWTGGPSAWDWEDISRLIFGRDGTGEKNILLTH
jgi:hypothetical protein